MAIRCTTITYVHIWGLDGKTPAEKCGIKIDGDNKWITLIQNASKKPEPKPQYTHSSHALQ